MDKREGEIRGDGSSAPIDMSAGISAFLLPFYNVYKNEHETLEEFVEGFFTEGGAIDIKLSPRLKTTIYGDDDEVEREHFLVGPDGL